MAKAPRTTQFLCRCPRHINRERGVVVSRRTYFRHRAEWQAAQRLEESSATNLFQTTRLSIEEPDIPEDNVDGAAFGVNVNSDEANAATDTKLVSWEHKNESRKRKAIQSLKMKFPYLRGSFKNWIPEWFFCTKSYQDNGEAGRSDDSKAYKAQVQKHKQAQLRQERVRAKATAQSNDNDDDDRGISGAEEAGYHSRSQSRRRSEHSRSTNTPSARGRNTSGGYSAFEGEDGVQNDVDEPMFDTHSPSMMSDFPDAQELLRSNSNTRNPRRHQPDIVVLEDKGDETTDSGDEDGAACQDHAFAQFERDMAQKQRAKKQRALNVEFAQRLREHEERERTNREANQARIDREEEDHLEQNRRVQEACAEARLLEEERRAAAAEQRRIKARRIEDERFDQEIPVKRAEWLQLMMQQEREEQEKREQEKHDTRTCGRVRQEEASQKAQAENNDRRQAEKDARMAEEKKRRKAQWQQDREEKAQSGIPQKSKVFKLVPTTSDEFSSSVMPSSRDGQRQAPSSASPRGARAPMPTAVPRSDPRDRDRDRGRDRVSETPQPSARKVRERSYAHLLGPDDVISSSSRLGSHVPASSIRPSPTLTPTPSLTRSADGKVINYASRGGRALAEFTSSDVASSDKGKRRVVGLARPPRAPSGQVQQHEPSRPPAPNFSQRVKRKYPALDNEIPLVAGDKKRVLAVTAHRNNAKARLMEKESKKYLQAQQTNVFEDHIAHEDSQVPSSFRLSGSSAAVLSSTSSSANAPPGYCAPPATALPPKASSALRSGGQRR
ncbi:hypothetical protein YB2330_006513 [Saitoella coloradoensis]